MVCNFIGCIKNPNIVVCISEPEESGFECSKGGGAKYHLDYKDSKDYIAMPHEDAEWLLTKCKNGEDP